MSRVWQSAAGTARRARFVIALGFFAGVLAAVWWFGPGQAPAGPPEPHGARGAVLRRIDEALTQKNVSAAEQARHEAYAVALKSRSWEAMMAAGEASLRIGEVTGLRAVSEARARQAFLSAFFRARNQKSVDGLLRAAEAFAALGDWEVASQCFRTAERLATHASDQQTLVGVRWFQGAIGDLRSRREDL